MLPVQVSGGVQWALVKHSTHLLVEPSSRHFGVGALHAVQLLPHEESLLHSTHVPLTHCLYEPHEPALQTQAVPLHVGVIPEQTVQVGPQCCAVLHGAHVPAFQ